MWVYFLPLKKIDGQQRTDISTGISPGIKPGANSCLHIACPGNNAVQPIRKQADGYKNSNKIFFTGKNPRQYQGENKQPVKGKHIGYVPEFFILFMVTISFHQLQYNK